MLLFVLFLFISPSLLPSQDGGPGTLVKASRDHNSAVAMSHQVYPYDTRIPPAMAVANYEAVMRTLSLKQVRFVWRAIEMRYLSA